MASKNIVSVLQEERTFAPAAGFAARSRVKPADLERMRREAAEDPSGFWARLARQELAWHTPFTVTLDDSAAPNYRWFTDGRLNVSFNCLDVHLEQRGDKTAIIFEGEPGDTRRLSLPRAARRGLQVRQCAEGTGYQAKVIASAIYHAARAGGSRRDARLQPHRGNPLGGLRRLLSTGAQGPYRGHRRQAGDHRGRRLARRTPDRAQGGGGQGAGRGLQDHRARHRPEAHRSGRSRCSQGAISGGTPRSRGKRRSASPSGWRRSIRSTCFIPRDRPASRRESSTRAAAICSARS